MPPDQPLPDLLFPWILTVRHPLEGGGGKFSLAERREIFAAGLPAAALVDIELRSLGPMAGIVESARSRNIGVIASFHDFQKTPPVKKLHELARRARDAGADVFKVAAWTASPSDVTRLLDLFQTCPLPLSVMGMGPLGPGTRVLFAQCGSVLNYGWLHRPNVPGQWSARELKRILTDQ